MKILERTRPSLEECDVRSDAARSSLGLVIAPQVLSEANGDYGGSFGS